MPEYIPEEINNDNALDTSMGINQEAKENSVNINVTGQNNTVRNNSDELKMKDNITVYGDHVSITKNTIIIDPFSKSISNDVPIPTEPISKQIEEKRTGEAGQALALILERDRNWKKIRSTVVRFGRSNYSDAHDIYYNGLQKSLADCFA